MHPSSSATAWQTALPVTSTCPSSSRAFSSPRRKRASAAAFISTPCARRSTSRSSTSRPARLAAGAVAPHPVVMAETAAKIDSDATDDEVIAQAEDELRKLAMPIKEACMTPAVKRSLYRHVAMLLDLRK
ncbi:MAG TPA: hypothetical protein DIU41_10690 [Oscillibacter sp.]|nr:hypothetical protein [Oscillibacter sp.]